MKAFILFLALLAVTNANLNKDIARVAERVDAVVGVSAIDLDTGRTISIRPDESFPMASVFKFPLAIEVLHRVDSGQLRLDRSYTLTPADFSLGHSPIRDAAKAKPVKLTLRQLIAAAVSQSDNTAGDYLLKLVNPTAVTSRMQELHANGIRIDRTEKEIIQTFGTPDGVSRYATDLHDTAAPVGMAALLGIVYRHREGLTPASHDFLVQLMTKPANPSRIGALLPKGTTVMHKSGTMPGTLNDVALVTSPDGKHHIALAIFTKGAKKSGQGDVEKVVEEIAKLIYDQFTTVTGNR